MQMGLMDGIAGWLRQIIAVLLLASIIDLLLPNRTMQRYVRLVAGLILLLTVATPVLHWMKGDFGSKLAEGLDIVEKSPQIAPDQLAMIESEGEKLRNRQSEQAANLVSTRLAAAIRSDVEANEQRAVRSVDVQTAQDKAGNWTVTSVKVVLERTDGGESSQAKGAIAPMKEIDPIASVDIHVEVGGELNSSSSNGSSSEDGDSRKDEAVGDQAQEAMAEETDLDSRTESRVVTLVANRFGITSALIKVSQTPASPDSVGASGSRR
ncbi:stage III sporulation protein AF [Cohnella yongneupensis]|uniref:Stage III sporulation protein AF n=1 Tax=Cohnella yongneupensis TaxID=425006 RepID=A0ABW0R8H6_9BACL